MGLLSLGTPLNWQQTKKYCDHVRDEGIAQLLEVWEAHKSRSNDPPLWGDELEYMIVEFDSNSSAANLVLRQEDILDTLIKAGKAKKFTCASFHQEYGRYMLEATPSEPYHADKLERVEKNMSHRRKIAQEYTDGHEFPLTLTTYPLLGVDEFAHPWDGGERPVSKSLFLPDSIINTHARFPTLTANIRERRGEKVDIRVPLYLDTNTAQAPPSGRPGAEEHKAEIYMDAMGFGMGSSCLQITYQAANIDQARSLYDQLVPFAPLFLALSAAAPLFRGRVADQDVRWSVISASVDDRTAVERGVEKPPADWAQHTHNTSPVIPKSRYDSVDCYIDPKGAEYNDIEVVTNERSRAQLRAAGMDEALSQHFAHLFIRDPLVIFEELLHQSSGSTDHFENLQSTNWQTIRFKPPPGPEIGWRVEFRSMDVQITDFENAAFSVVVILLIKAIIKHGLCYYMPISKVDANMRTAHLRDPTARKYWFPLNGKVEEQSLAQIFDHLVPLLKQDAAPHLHRYVDLVAERAANKRVPAATWIRNFVLSHEDYKGDSVVSRKINYDLLQTLRRVTLGEWDHTGSWLGGLAKPEAN